jgi:uncharacterized protein (TIGR03067 family)
MMAVGLVTVALASAAAMPASVQDPGRAEAKEAAIKTMQERLQGTWKCVALHTSGVKRQLDMTCVVRANTWETRLDGRVYQAGTFNLVNLDASPKHVDWVIAFDAAEVVNIGKTFHGIFMLDGDSLCCVTSDAAVSPRPEVFFTEPNDGCYASMYKRVDPKQDQ